MHAPKNELSAEPSPPFSDSTMPQGAPSASDAYPPVDLGLYQCR